MRSKVVAILAGTAVALAAGGGLVWWATQGWRPTLPPPPDPRLSYDTPFRNVRPEVKYVGDDACAGCHRDVARDYRKHPMGRSFFQTAEVVAGERFDESVHNPFTKFDTEFRILRVGDKVVHHAERKAADGRTLYTAEAEAAYAMGSNTRGRSYLVERDGYLFQSPISWYSQKQIWDLAPGYSRERLFDRPIPSACLFCHVNDADPVPYTINQYRKPLFRQHAIGCERCHGPGELHVAQRAGSDPPGDVDTSIVNPKHLAPSLRENVCEQCHLQAEVQVPRQGRSPFDYRPGLPSHLFWTSFVRTPKLVDGHKAVSHVEQMRVSRCFQASDGKLGCTSCHDPHARPAEAEMAAFYRGRCLSCHAEKPCSVPVAQRRQKQPDDSCFACHMPRAASSDIAHTAVTDHRVPRKPDAEPRRGGPPTPLAPDEVPLRAFHPERADPLDPSASRDLGLALVQLIRQQPDASRFLGPLAEPRLEAAANADPRDVEGREGWAFSLWARGNADKALTVYEGLLEEQPRHESALSEAVLIANRLGRTEAASRYARRLIEVNPWNAEYPHQLALALASDKQWGEAAEACRSALRLHPSRLATRQLLIRCLLRHGDVAAATAELETLIALEPARGGELRRWFADQSR